VSETRTTTRAGSDLLVRRPWLDEPGAHRRASLIDAIEELEELAALLHRGLLSRAEFDRQKHRLLPR
jgi:hypothetical protein